MLRRAAHPAGFLYTKWSRQPFVVEPWLDFGSVLSGPGWEALAQSLQRRCLPSPDDPSALRQGFADYARVMTEFSPLERRLRQEKSAGAVSEPADEALAARLGEEARALCPHVYACLRLPGPLHPSVSEQSEEVELPGMTAPAEVEPEALWSSQEEWEARLEGLGYAPLRLPSLVRPALVEATLHGDVGMGEGCRTPLPSPHPAKEADVPLAALVGNALPAYAAAAARKAFTAKDGALRWQANGKAYVLRPGHAAEDGAEEGAWERESATAFAAFRHAADAWEEVVRLREALEAALGPARPLPPHQLDAAEAAALVWPAKARLSHLADFVSRRTQTAFVEPGSKGQDAWTHAHSLFLTIDLHALDTVGTQC